MKKLFIIFILITTSFGYGQEEKKEYTVFIKEIITKRDSFLIKYEEADLIKKDSIILEAQNYLIHTIATELFPYWYGTKWDFNGTTRTPQKGRIACGYFITNILTDIGFHIPRVKWAQSPSEVFIKKLSYQKIKKFTNKPVTSVEEYLMNSGNGIYLAGLDYHTGFVHVENEKVRFIHADYYEPEIGVTSEKLDAPGPFVDSSYRVIGKLFSSEMILSWMKKELIN